MCSVLLQLSPNASGNLRWSATDSGIIAFFIPSKGILSPGQQQSIIVYVDTSCPRAAFLIFSTKNGKIAIPWNC